MAHCCKNRETSNFPDSKANATATTTLVASVLTLTFLLLSFSFLPIFLLSIPFHLSLFIFNFLSFSPFRYVSYPSLKTLRFIHSFLTLDSKPCLYFIIIW
ncbi:hypothetical protein RIF29_14338 [Crotalaria pallida]|uniref:Transmembrane protein n=1 Tax=Crotalaria pallida TaxID=3830 RepID=A0AAN9FD57_CROPI